MHPCISCTSILHSIACNCFAISPTYGQTSAFLLRRLEPVFRQRCSRRATVAGGGKSRATRLTTVSGELPTYGKCFRGISATALTLTYPDLRTATRLTASLTERTYTCASALGRYGCTHLEHPHAGFLLLLLSLCLCVICFCTSRALSCTFTPSSRWPSLPRGLGPIFHEPGYRSWAASWAANCLNRDPQITNKP